MVEQTVKDVKGGSTTDKRDACCHPNWQPQWVVGIGQGCEVGVTKDDGCWVVLCKNWHGEWRPSKHIPPTVAKFIYGLI